jgi:hypothetical protein
MRGKLWFLGGLAAGFILGARAGREKYEEIVSTARKFKEHPTVQEARGVVQEQANRLMSEGKDKLSQSRFAETKVGERLLSGSESTTGTTGTSSTGSTGSTDSTLATTGSTTGRSNIGTTGSTSSGTSY